MTYMLNNKTMKNAIKIIAIALIAAFIAQDAAWAYPYEPAHPIQQKDKLAASSSFKDDAFQERATKVYRGMAGKEPSASAVQETGHRPNRIINFLRRLSFALLAILAGCAAGEPFSMQKVLIGPVRDDIKLLAEEDIDADFASSARGVAYGFEGFMSSNMRRYMNWLIKKHIPSMSSMMATEDMTEAMNTAASINRKIDGGLNIAFCYSCSDSFFGIGGKNAFLPELDQRNIAVDVLVMFDDNWPAGRIPKNVRYVVNIRQPHALAGRALRPDLLENPETVVIDINIGGISHLGFPVPPWEAKTASEAMASEKYSSIIVKVIDFAYKEKMSGKGVMRAKQSLTDMLRGAFSDSIRIEESGQVISIMSQEESPISKSYLGLGIFNLLMAFGIAGPVSRAINESRDPNSIERAGWRDTLEFIMSDSRLRTLAASGGLSMEEAKGYLLSSGAISSPKPQLAPRYIISGILLGTLFSSPLLYFSMGQFGLAAAFLLSIATFIPGYVAHELGHWIGGDFGKDKIKGLRAGPIASLMLLTATVLASAFFVNLDGRASFYNIPIYAIFLSAFGNYFAHIFADGWVLIDVEYGRVNKRDEIRLRSAEREAHRRPAKVVTNGGNIADRISEFLVQNTTGTMSHMMTQFEKERELWKTLEDKRRKIEQLQADLRRSEPNEARPLKIINENAGPNPINVPIITPQNVKNLSMLVCALLIEERLTAYQAIRRAKRWHGSKDLIEVLKRLRDEGFDDYEMPCKIVLIGEALERLKESTRIAAPDDKSTEINSEDANLKSLLASIHALTTPEGAGAPLLPAGARIMLSETLFDEADIRHLTGDGKETFGLLGKDSPIQIVPPKIIRDASINKNTSRETLACVLSSKDYDNKELWNNNNRAQNKASMIILNEDLKRERYLYLEGVVGLAGSIMRNRADKISMYLNLLFNISLKENDARLVEILMSDPAEFANLIRFKPISPIKTEALLNEYKSSVENYLIMA